MGFSPLASMSRRIPDGGRSAPRQSAITGVGIHHNAGINAYHQATAPGREVSANYWITNDGEIIPQIDESRRAFTSGHPAYPAGALADHRNITVEVSNSEVGGQWRISPAAQEALSRLIADVYKRYGLGRVTRGADRGVGLHRDWVGTECPGPYITQNIGTIIDRANQILEGEDMPLNQTDLDNIYKVVRNVVNAEFLDKQTPRAGKDANGKPQTGNTTARSWVAWMDHAFAAVIREIRALRADIAKLKK